MRNYSSFPSLFLQQHNSEFSQNPVPDPSISLQMCSNMNETRNQLSLHSEVLETNQAQLNHVGSTFFSRFSYLTPNALPTAHASGTMSSLAPNMINQCSSSNAEKGRHFGPPFESVYMEMLRDSRKRPLEEFARRDGIFSMINNTALPDQPQLSKRKTIQPTVIKAPARRSQKLSDKITSLQKVVSPYGKTDTASVLQETCMYIRIAHQEIRRLKVSYFGTKSLQTQPMHSNPESWYRDLRSKGLCLVPLSMASQLAIEDSDGVSNGNQDVPKIMNVWGFDNLIL